MILVATVTGGMIGENDSCEGNARDGGGLCAARTEHITDSAMVCTNERIISATRAVCRCCLPVHGGCLPHVEQLMNAFMSSPLNPKALHAACKAGASKRTLAMILSRTAPNWASAIYDAAQGGHLHVFRWMTEREDGRGRGEGILSVHWRLQQEVGTLNSSGGFTTVELIIGMELKIRTRICIACHGH